MKQKGFTLIELLAVIVILAIIALIATPIVLNIIKDSKESANLQSAQFYIDAAEMAITKQMMDDPTFEPTSCDIQPDGNIKCGETLVKVEVSGETPTSGTIKLENGKIKDVKIKIQDKTIVEKDNKLVFEEESTDDYIIDEDLEFTYSDNTSVATLAISKDLADKLRVFMDYDYIIDDDEVKKISGFEYSEMGFILYSDFISSQDLFFVQIEDEKLTFVFFQEITGKHNIKIANPRPPEERIFFQIEENGDFGITSYDFILGNANILIKDNEGTEYYNDTVELEVYGFIGADNGCRGNLPNLLNVYNALNTGKTITIEVTQIVDGKQIVSSITKDIDSMFYNNEKYLSSKHILSFVASTGC